MGVVIDGLHGFTDCCKGVVVVALVLVGDLCLVGVATPDAIELVLELEASSNDYEKRRHTEMNEQIKDTYWM